MRSETHIEETYYSTCPLNPAGSFENCCVHWLSSAKAVDSAYMEHMEKVICAGRLHNDLVLALQ